MDGSPQPPRVESSPRKSKAPRPPVPSGTRTVAWAASRARIRKDGSWNSLPLRRASSASMSRRIVSMFMFAHQARSSPWRATAKVLNNSSAELRDLAPALIVLEATGGFEITVAAALASAGLPLAVVNPRQIRDFARATGRLAKTDALDAQIIALFAERIRPEPRPIADADSQSSGRTDRPPPSGGGNDRHGDQPAASGAQSSRPAHAQGDVEDPRRPNSPNWIATSTTPCAVTHLARRRRSADIGTGRWRRHRRTP